MKSALDELITAVEDGDTRTVSRLIDEGECIKNPEFRTCAFFYGFAELDIIRLLVGAGADVNAINEVGEWALLNASWEGNAEAVAYLLSMGAKPNLTSTGETALHMGVYSNNIEVVRLLLDAGADINAQDVDGWTCLFWLKSQEMAAFLLSRGAHPSITNEICELPDDWKEIPQAVRILLRAHRLKANGT